MINMGAALRASYPARLGSTLWTEAISDCCAIATYDQQRGDRSLIHLPGGQTDNDYYDLTARLLSPGSTVIVAAGSKWNQRDLDSFLNDLRTEIEERIIAIAAKGNNPLTAAQLNITWSTYSGNNLLQPGQDASFVFKANGEYGIINPALPEESGEAAPTAPTAPAGNKKNCCTII